MSTKLRWGILGCAQIATNAVMPAIQASSSGTLAAIASRRLEKSREVAGQFGIGRAYGSYEELLADPEVDAVYIPLPNHLHREWVIRAAEAGKHVLCEKPLALTAAEAGEMVEACRKAGVHLAEAFMYRHHPRMKQVRELIADGAIGEIRGFRGAFTYNDAEDTGNIRFRAEWGGGSIYDVGCYPMSAARFLLGAEPEAVTAHARFSPEHGGVDMMTSGLVEFPGGVSLIFDCGMWASNRQELEILGTTGRLYLPMPFNAREEDADFEWIRDGADRETVRGIGANPYVRQADDFAAAAGGAAPIVSPGDPAANMALLEACLKSARERRRVELVPRSRI
ncbi:Gfo/Idh/MocA family oxidoreductase [Paenibacillus spiritus]|uniref:Gfo/Idh/MocA family oxidoreductase n=1 Tax=Paenibacillus spiritus TaxID=2496557 RepID=A0A5J5GLK8_9BACL|nr:Gfo/Idh/MocA family oxidoreductase [Paenibacillus spiritus]KAA9008404.1 Gfo/Idh/MocA family oxidoreductase [Paenibacillus spiritus]